MINKKLLDDLCHCLDTIVSAEEHLSINELRGLFYAMMITPIAHQPASWVSALFYGEHPFIDEEHARELSQKMEPVYDAYRSVFKDNKLRFPFDLSKLDEATAENAYDWCRGFFVGLLVTENLWFGAEDEPIALDNQELAAIRSSARLFAGLLNQDFSRFEPQKIDELQAIIREQGQEPSDELMAATLFPHVPSAVKTLHQFGVRLLNQASQDAQQAKKIKPPRKMGRNELCFCGSGLKYKRCCGAN